MMLSGSYPLDVYALSLSPNDFVSPGNALNTGILHSDSVEDPGKPSTMEPSAVVPILSPEDPGSLFSLWMHFQYTGGTAGGDGTEAHPVVDLAFMILLGIGMLSLGVMKRRNPIPH
jgi:hypothetical protein